MYIWKLCRRSSLAVAITVIALFAALPMASAHESTDTISVVPINGKVDGKTYGKWSEVWWRQAFAVTVDTFAHCTDMNKNGGAMWFLAGTLVAPSEGINVTRDCTVPSGKHIMFPVVNAEWSQAEAVAQQPPTGACMLAGVTPSGTDYAALSACAKALVKLGTNLEADVDGTTLDLTNQEAASPFPLFPFKVTVPNNPLCGFPLHCPVTSKSASDGIWIILNPLSAGPHTIHLHLEVPLFNFTLDVKYRLMVQ